MLDDDLLIRAKSNPPRRFNWDRLLSIMAIVISLIAAGSTIWQAQIADQARRDVIELAQDRPKLHVLNANVNWTPSAKNPNGYRRLALTVKNTGQAPAHNVWMEYERTVQDDDSKVPPQKVHKPISQTGMMAIDEQQEVLFHPENFEKPVAVEISGTIYYSREDGRVYQTPICYTFPSGFPANYKALASSCATIFRAAQKVGK